MRSRGQKSTTTTKEQSAMPQHNGPVRTRAGQLHEFFARWISNSALGVAFGHWASTTLALPQLRQLVGAEMPWTTLQKPLSDSTVVLLSTGGGYLRNDRPFNRNSDATFRVISKDAQPDDLAIAHQAYDRTDALRDINLVFPMERLRELEAEPVSGRLAEDHYGFGLMGSAERLIPSIKEVAQRIRESGVDLARAPSHPGELCIGHDYRHAGRRTRDGRRPWSGVGPDARERRGLDQPV